MHVRGAWSSTFQRERLRSRPQRVSRIWRALLVLDVLLATICAVAIRVEAVPNDGVVAARGVTLWN